MDYDLGQVVILHINEKMSYYNQFDVTALNDARFTKKKDKKVTFWKSTK